MCTSDKSITEKDTNPRYLSVIGTENVQFGYNSDGRYFTRRNSTSKLTDATFTPLGANNLLIHKASANIDGFSINGAAQPFQTSGPPGANSTFGNGIHLLKAYHFNSFYVESGTIQEVVLFDTDQTTVEDHINNYYALY